MWQALVPVADGAASSGLAGSPATVVPVERAAHAATSAGAAAASLDPWELIVNAGPVVLGVLVFLLAASVLCWGIIAAKAGTLASSRARARKFLKALEGGADPEQLRSAPRDNPHARVYHAAVEEMESRPAPPGSARPGDREEGPIRRLERTLARSVDGEITRMEGWLGLLATIGSTAPFIGLFGTVWGIMSSFLAIGAQESATLAVVAPGIAEALIATAVGLFAAIPAVVGYNLLVRRVRVWNEDLAAFAAWLVNDADARRNGAAPDGKGGPMPAGTLPQFKITE